jgi:hypothetical protein
MFRAAALAVLIFAASAGQASAWGATGHRLVGQVAAEGLPGELPGFLRTSEAATEIGELSREPDRSKGAGKLHDSGRDPAHFLDLDDAGKVMGGPTLDTLPPTRAEFETQLRAAGVDSWKAGWLPYAIVDQHQQLVKDFAYWRILTAAETQAASPERRAWFAEDRRRREALILSTIGTLSHYVGDGAQPLHMSVHYNGWGNLPNPKGYTRARIHGPFEGALVRDGVTAAAVRGELAPFRTCNCALVEPLYALEKAGGLKPGDPRGVALATERLGLAASELRDLVVEAWRSAGTSEAGWPSVKVVDVEAGRVDPFESLYGAD